ncbi:hypothetical protein STA3757_10810 [Stanieria sp. NIES-3757]|nr:hypothetical protein STA3757_10810 [Stanieria sp. NIES-3757]
MSNDNQELATQQVVNVKWAERWQVYHRLQALEIECRCGSNRPLQIEINNTKTAIQLWSVARQVTASRYELMHWLENCWQIESDRQKN